MTGLTSAHNAPREMRYPSGHTVHIHHSEGETTRDLSHTYAQASPASAANVPTPAGRIRPTAVLLSGCGLGSACWDQVIAALPDWRIITVDRPGRLGTSCDAFPSLVAETRFVRELLEDEGSAVVVAHSMASFQAEALARLVPHLVTAVVLVDPSAAPLNAHHSRVAPRLSALAAQLTRLGPLRRLASALWRAGLQAQTQHPELIDTARWIPTWNSRSALVATLKEALAFRGQAADLLMLRRRQGSAAPVRAIILEAPPYTSTRARKALLASFRNAHVRQVHSRHLMMLDAPETIADSVTDVGNPSTSLRA
ncbi:alpha/beta hydrolase [Actinobaculum sp. 313]|uniref:alpha/beta fold hydrolase n=1 Tax=Actinobaculum sp. 313 TaxID=2495645 RepID=UPI000D525FCF|nr:alpha/beta hydrolase [Actinobaculum sp. 313]AWE42410.1 hypothetical protein DDD63_06220 [Actinobaculum sp. 313]